MAPHRIPGNEPDNTDMAHDETPASGRSSDPGDAELAEEEEAAKLGDFA